MLNERIDRDSLLPLHDELIKQNAEDIKEIKQVTNGLPQTIERIEYVVTQLSKNFEKFLEVADKKYQTKEMCGVCNDTTEREVNEVNKRVDTLEKKYDYLVKGLVVVLITAVGFGLKFGIDLIHQAIIAGVK